MSFILKSVDFVVYGLVRSIYFHHYAQKHGMQLGVRGCYQYTSGGNVVGTVEGPIEKVTEMVNWLMEVGGSASNIGLVEIKNDKFIDDYTYTVNGKLIRDTPINMNKRIRSIIKRLRRQK